MKNYNLEKYHCDLDKIGLEKTWNKICDFIINNQDLPNILLDENLSFLYENGLAWINKKAKQTNGQYFTPKDVALLLGQFLKQQYKPSYNVADICCGVGNLILGFLEQLTLKEVQNLINNKKLYLYDLDPIALKICKVRIVKKYSGFNINDLNTISADFLDKNIHLPKNTIVISNPPYFKTEIKPNWENTLIQQKTKELYSSFIEKILKESIKSVIITPQSFLGADKFFVLRKFMNNYSGQIYCFDNVPGQIFFGKKEGVFNSNCSNSIRAAIIVADNIKPNGFQISPLIRFKNSQRNKVLKPEFLNSVISCKKQIVDHQNPNYLKLFKTLEKVFYIWKQKSNGVLKDDVIANSKYKLFIANTCRYYTTCSITALNRSGVYEFCFDDELKWKFYFLLLNSSFNYWWWRINDGGITYTKSLMLNLPSLFITKDDEKEIDLLFKEVCKTKIIKTKNNCGIKENVDYDKESIKKINNFLAKKLGLDGIDFDIIHLNEIK